PSGMDTNSIPDPRSGSETSKTPRTQWESDSGLEKRATHCYNGDGLRGFSYLSAMENPLLTPFGTPFESIPFNDITTAHFKPAILQLIADAKKEIDAIVDNPEPASFANTIAAMDHAGKALHIASATFFNLDAAETNDEIQQLAQELSPILAEYSNDIMLNEGLFSRVKQVHDDTDPDTLTPEAARLLDKTYRGFARNGALLSDAD